MLAGLQRLFLENSIILVAIIAVMVLGSAGIILWYYTANEEDQHKDMSKDSLIFAGIAVAVTLIISFFAFWVMLCPVYNPGENFIEINQKIQLKSIAVFFLCVLALFPSVDIFIKRYIKSEERHKDISMVEAVTVVGSSIISIMIIAYLIIDTMVSVNPSMMPQQLN